MVAAAFAALLAGCGSFPAQTTSARLQVSVEVANSLRRYEHAYLLQAGDQLEVFVYRHAEFSRKVVIRPDGVITLPLLEDVRAVGKTPRELAQLLNERFAQRLRNAEVTVIVENAPEPVVFVVGQAGTPRALPLRTARTVAQALAQSGDANKLAVPAAISVIRLNADGYLEAHNASVEGASPSQPEIYMALSSMLLKPNDLIVVPESLRAQIMQVLQDVNTVLAPLFNAVLLRELTR